MEITNVQIQMVRDVHLNAKIMYRQTVTDIAKENNLPETAVLDIVRKDGRTQYWNGKMIGIENIFEILDIGIR